MQVKQIQSHHIVMEYFALLYNSTVNATDSIFKRGRPLVNLNTIY